MVRCKTVLGTEEYRLLSEIALSHPKNKRGRAIARAIACFGAAFWLGLGVYIFWERGMTDGTAVFMASFCGVSTVLFFVWACRMKRFQRARLEHAAEKAERVRQGQVPEELRDGSERNYVFSEDDVKVTGKMGETAYRWDAFSGYEERGHYICLTLCNRNLVLVDKNTLSGDEVEELLGLLQEKIIREK